MALDTPAKRLKWAREQTNRWGTATEAAEAHGWKVSTYLGHENGDRNPSRDAAKRYAKAFKVRWEWILEGEGGPHRAKSGARTAWAVGYIGGGAEVYPIDDHEVGAGLEEVEIPPGVPDDAVLVIVRGDSMFPRYFDNEYLFYVRRGHDPSELLNRECVVKLQDGRTFVKLLRKGSTRGLYNLESWNAPPIEDKAVEWAAPVLARVNRGHG